MPEPEDLNVAKMRAAAMTTALAAAMAIAGAGDAAERPVRRHQLLLGLGFSAPYNLEEPFINMAQTRAANWRFETRSKGRLEGSDALAAGLADPATFMPTKKTGAAEAAAGVFLPGAGAFRDYYADTYVLDWRGKARGLMQRWEGRVEEDRGANSVAYTLKPFQVGEASLRFTEIGDGFGKVRFYRQKYEALLERGEIWNPAFIDYVRRYDVVRTMDIQSTNNIQVRSFDQIATMDEAWGQRASITWPEPPYFSAPYEILFNLGVKADVAIWLTIPPEIGAPISPADPSLRQEHKPTRLDFERLKAVTAGHARETLASPAWDVFAKEFADRYLASGYPLTRPLYVEIGNEIWNFASGFAVSSNYAVGIAQGLNPKWRIGQGYGALSARFALALEKEFARRKVRPNVVYVLASHTANPWRTKQAIEGFADTLRSYDLDPKPYLQRTGVAVTNYYGQFNPIGAALFGSDDPKVYAPKWIAAIKEDPAALSARLSAHLKKGPAGAKLTGAWIAARWAEHREVAEKAGSRFLGAYEGGSHLLPPAELKRSKEFLAWWESYHWGEEGADIARAINTRLIAGFPGAIIANYESIGEIRPDSPWIDGHYARPTPMLDMWDEFARPDRVK